MTRQILEGTSAATARVWFIAPLIKASTFKLAVLALGGYVKEGYYWIQRDGAIEVAYFTPEEFEDIETGKTVTGVWHLTRAMTSATTVKLRFSKGRCSHRNRKH